MESAVPGANNLTEIIDSTPVPRALTRKERLLVVLRDGRKLYGVLRSYDQFGNVLLDDTIERYYVDLEYGEECLGALMVRGENIVLVGEIDEEEFKSVSRRMSRFKRPLDTLLPQYRQFRRTDDRARLLAYALGATDMAEYDAY